MNQYVKEFFHRGLMFGGFGPVIAGIVYFLLDSNLEHFSLTGGQVLIAILSTYGLAFVQAGGSVFHQIEHWSVAKGLFFHFFSLYLSYVLCYLVNSWIPFEKTMILIFTAIFAVGYFVIWLTVFFSVKAVQKRLNQKLNL
jgi:hypothetical protein